MEFVRDTLTIRAAFLDLANALLTGSIPLNITTPKGIALLFGVYF